jgi:TolA-binding protein
MYTSSFSRSCLGAALWLCLSSPVAGGEAEDTYAVAVGHYSQGRWKLAEQEFARFLQDFPDHAHASNAILFQAESQVQQGNHAVASEGFARFLQREPDHRYSHHATFRAAETAFLTGDHDAARRQLERFRDRYPDDKLNAYALSYLGEIALTAGDWRQACQLYGESLRRFPQGPLADDSRFGMGRAREIQGDLDAALATYEVLVTAGGRLADDAQLQIGVSHYNRRRYEEAAAAFDALIAEFPDSDLQADARYWKGMCRIALRDWSDAAETLSTAAELHPQHELTGAMLYWLGEAYRHLGETAKAASCYQRVCGNWPDCTWADDSLRTQVQLALDDCQYEDAIRLARQFDARYPDSPVVAQLRQSLARALLKQKEYGQAAEILLDLVQGSPELPENSTAEAVAPVRSTEAATALQANLYYLGLAYLGEKKYAEALEALSQMQPPEDAQLLQDGMWVALATAHIGLGHYAQAIDPLRQYLQSQPDGAEASKCRVQLMASLAHSGQLDEALQAHSALTESDKRHPAYLPAVDIVAEGSVRGSAIRRRGKSIRRSGRGGGNACDGGQGMVRPGMDAFPPRRIPVRRGGVRASHSVVSRRRAGRRSSLDARPSLRTAGA